MATKIIFFGTSEFAVPALEILAKKGLPAQAGYEIIAVITNPDEPAGRKKVLAPPPVKVAAEKYGIKILQPEKLRGNPGLAEELKNLKPDVGVVAAYGKIIPAEIINLPRYSTLNIHPSLLPKYRGPTPIQSTILNGEKETGVTIIKIDEEVDHGDIISKSQISISNEDNYKILENKLAKLGAELLIKILPDYLAGKIEPRPQDHSQATFTKKFTRDDARIDWNKTAEEIDRQIRALNPEPGTWTTWSGKVLKILEAKILMSATSGYDRSQMWSVGKVLLENGKITVETVRGGIILITVQPEGKKSMSAEDFVRGNDSFIGAVLE